MPWERRPGAMDEVLRPHFQKEGMALPPLGMLNVTGDEPAGSVDEAIVLTHRFSRELPRMLEDHVMSALRSEVLSLEAQNAGKDKYAVFARELTQHARVEKEIMYSASPLVGSYLRLWKARRKANPGGRRKARPRPAARPSSGPSSAPRTG